MEPFFSNRLFLLVSWVVLGISLYQALRSGEQATVKALIALSYMYWGSILKQGGKRARNQLKSFGISKGVLALFHLATGFMCVIAVMTSILFHGTGVPYVVYLFLPAIGLPIIAFQHEVEDFENEFR